MLGECRCAERQTRFGRANCPVNRLLSTDVVRRGVSGGAHPRVEPQMRVPPTPFTKNILGLERQATADGTLIWTLPSGHTYITTPGSALLFPTLCAPTATLPPPDPARADRTGDPTAMMPIRKTTRAQNRAHDIAPERRQNHKARQADRPQPQHVSHFGPAPHPIQTRTHRPSDGSLRADPRGRPSP
jgi:hypothetical protein